MTESQPRASMSTRGPVLIVGTGLLGTSLALALRAADVEVQLSDTSPTSLALARDMGAIGASSFGAGWGGSVYALVPADDAQDFASQWLQSYRDREQKAERAAAIVTRPGSGACQLL